MTLPPPDEWTATVLHSVLHSLDNHRHILGPYEGDDGIVHMCCDGSGDPNEPSNCRFDTATLGTP